LIDLHEDLNQATSLNQATKVEKTSVATSWLVLHWMCDSPLTGCAQRIAPIYMCCKQAIIVITACDVYCCFLPQVWSFAHVPLRLSDRNTSKNLKCSFKA